MICACALDAKSYPRFFHPPERVADGAVVDCNEMSCTNYSNLPGFIFKEFLEVENEVQGIIKDDGFRKSIVTSTGVSRMEASCW